MTKLYSSLLWLCFIAGAPLLTAALAVITIPLLLTDVEAGLVILLLPGVVTLAPLAGLVIPGETTRSIYGPAVFFAAARVATPIAIYLAWGSYFEESARDGAALAAVVVVTAAVSLLLWAWSLEYTIEVAPQLAPDGVQVTARRVDIEPSLQREQRKEVLRSRERRGRISRALEATRPVPYAGAAPEQEGVEGQPTVVWGSSLSAAASNGNTGPTPRRGPLRFRKPRRKTLAERTENDGSAADESPPASLTERTPDAGAAADEGPPASLAEPQGRGDVFTGHRDNR